LGEEFFDQMALVLVANAGKQFGAEFSDRFRLIEWHTVVHLPATEMAGHALRLKDGFELSFEIDSGFGGG
jgi:hypothetical protein